MAHAAVRARLDPFMVLMPSAIIAFAASVSLVGAVGPNVAGFALVLAVVAVVGMAAANFALHYHLAIVEGNLRLSKYAGLPPTEIPLGSLQGVSVSAHAAGRVLGKVKFRTGGKEAIEIAPRMWRKEPLTALVSELQGLGVEVDEEVWPAIAVG